MNLNFMQKLKSGVKREPVHIIPSGWENIIWFHDNHKIAGVVPICFLCVVFTLCVFLLPQSAWALQAHGAPEGLYAHQMAHFFLMAALVYLGWDIGRSAFVGRGWTLLKIFCVLFFLWNAVAFVGHAMTTSMVKADFYTEEGYWLSRMLGPFDITKTVYYVTKLDHLLLVPAILFLVLSLRSFFLDSNQGDEK